MSTLINRYALDESPGSGSSSTSRDVMLEIGWVTIPSGDFWFGENETKKRLYRPRPFRISKYPVTNGLYREFISDRPDYGVPKHWDPKKRSFLLNVYFHPVKYVSWDDAQAFCQWASEKLSYVVRLPTEAEWEHAARGDDGRLYPWGNTWEAYKCNSRESGQDDTTNVDEYPKGVSPYGVWDMSGNVWEWTAEKGITRGGCWINDYRNMSTTSRRDNRGFDGDWCYVGFRVATDAM